jgi:hypothetical protein
MPTRKSREFKTEPGPKQRKSKIADEYPFPNPEERLPPIVPGACNAAMGDSEEIVAWLRGFPRNTQTILILFANEASYRMHGPIFWHVVRQLPEIVARIRRGRFEQVVDALMELKLR